MTTSQSETSPDQSDDRFWRLLQQDLETFVKNENVIYSDAFSKWIVENIATCGFLPQSDKVRDAFIENLQEAIEVQQLDVTCLQRAVNCGLIFGEENGNLYS